MKYRFYSHPPTHPERALSQPNRSIMGPHYLNNRPIRATWSPFFSAEIIKSCKNTCKRNDPKLTQKDRIQSFRENEKSRNQAEMKRISHNQNQKMHLDKPCVRNRKLGCDNNSNKNFENSILKYVGVKGKQNSFPTSDLSFVQKL